MKRVRIVAGIGASALSLALVGCGGTSKNHTSVAPANKTAVALRSTPAPTMTRHQAAKAYLAAIAPTDAAGAALGKELETDTDSTPGPVISAQARPLERQLVELSRKLLDLASAYPPVAVGLKALVRAYSPVSRDLRSAATQKSVNASSWLQRLVSDLNRTQTAASIVRSNLGLPPAKP